MGTGNTTPRADAFLGSIGSPNLTQRVSPSRLRHTSGGFTNQKPYTLRPGQFHCLARLPCCVTPVNALDLPVQVPRSPNHSTRRCHRKAWVVSITSSSWTAEHWYRNINPLSNDYACRPRPRPRLTQ